MVRSLEGKNHKTHKYVPSSRSEEIKVLLQRFFFNQAYLPYKTKIVIGAMITNQ